MGFSREREGHSGVKRDRDRRAKRQRICPRERDRKTERGRVIEKRIQIEIGALVRQKEKDCVQKRVRERDGKREWQWDRER